MARFFVAVAVVVVAAAALGGVRGIGEELLRTGDEIVVCGRLFHTGTTVVTWMDVGGYDAYRTERRYVPWSVADYAHTVAGDMSPPGTNATYIAYGPARYSGVRANISADVLNRVRGGSGWDLPTLQSTVNKFVIHYDQTGYSQLTFQTLHDLRDLSIHFMLDLDGTIYQTLDLKDQARHATIANPNSIGIEVANIGAYAFGDSSAPFDSWYARNPTTNQTYMTFPAGVSDTFRNRQYQGAPLRSDPIPGSINGAVYQQYDFTAEQYAALIKLTATLSVLFPSIALVAPMDPANPSQVMPYAFPSKAAFDGFRGVMGHYHVQTNKIDPGPAFQWSYLLSEAQKLVNANGNNNDNGGSGGGGAKGGAIAAGIILSLAVLGAGAAYYYCVIHKRKQQQQTTRAATDGEYRNFN